MDGKSRAVLAGEPSLQFWQVATEKRTSPGLAPAPGKVRVRPTGLVRPSAATS